METAYDCVCMKTLLEKSQEQKVEVHVGHFLLFFFQSEGPQITLVLSQRGNPICICSITRICAVTCFIDYLVNDMSMGCMIKSYKFSGDLTWLVTEKEDDTMKSLWEDINVLSPWFQRRHSNSSTRKTKAIKVLSNAGNCSSLRSSENFSSLVLPEIEIRWTIRYKYKWNWIFLASFAMKIFINPKRQTLLLGVFSADSFRESVEQLGVHAGWSPQFWNILCGVGYR